MNAKLYGLKKCSTCKKALDWFSSEGIAHEFTDYREQPLAPDDLVGWAQQVGWTKVVNRASMTWRQLDESLKDPQTDEEWLGLIRSHEALVRRPVIVTSKGVQFGFNLKKLPEIL